MTLCCCDRLDFPGAPRIASGLSVLPRQVGIFADFRAALLGEIRRHPELAAWRAREGDDFGVMMLEWWAYVLDVVAFYDSEIAQERLLRSARQPTSLSSLTALIGYVPRPPIAAHALLATIAEPGEPVTIPAGAGFRSDAFDDEAPQVFESSADVAIAPTLNEWTLAPIRPQTIAAPASAFLIEPASKGVAEGQILAVEWSPGGALSATRVKAVKPVTALDGASYLELGLAGAIGAAGTASLAELRLWTPALRAGISLTATTPIAASGSGTAITLDTLYPQIRTGDVAVVETSSGGLIPTRVTAVTTVLVPFVPAPTGGSGPTPADINAPATRVTVAAAVGTTTASGTRVHFGAVRAGTPLAPALPFVQSDDLPPNVPLAGPVEPLQIVGSGTVLLRDARDRGAQLDGTVEVDADGNGTLTPASGSLPFDGLRTPIAAFGNVIAVTRGASVEERLGRGNALADFQTLKLTKTPLTYLSDPSHPSGRRSTLRIFVAGIEWREVDSLFIAGREDRVFTIRRNQAGDFVVMFGGMGYGQRLPDGAPVVARYRYGGGAAAPGAGQIRQLAGARKGVRRVFNPLAAYGGSEGDAPEDIRLAAPASTLTMGRAVSLVDFEAMARDFGAINARAEADWNPKAQRPVVKVTVIVEGDESGQSAAALQGYLTARAAEGTLVIVEPAVAIERKLKVEYLPDLTRDPAVVEAAVIAALADPLTGPIALRNVPIGASLFRAALLARVMAATGVEQVERLLVDGAPAPFALEAPAGHYLNFLPFTNR
jgi:predicted phage baseplate assembly protein